MEKNIKYIKPTAKERLEKKILNQSMAELIRLNEHFKAKKQRMQNVRDAEEAKRLQNLNLYHHEYARIKNYLDTTTVDPGEAAKLEDRRKEILDRRDKEISKMRDGGRNKTKYDELLKGK